MPLAASSAIVDIIPMNARILSLNLGPAVSNDTEAIDRHIDHMLSALFDGDPEQNPFCGNFYCTGYWPADMEGSHATPAS